MFPARATLRSPVHGGSRLRKGSRGEARRVVLHGGAERGLRVVRTDAQMIGGEGDVNDAHGVGDRLGGGKAEVDCGGGHAGNTHGDGVHRIETVEVGVERQVGVVSNGADERPAPLRALRKAPWPPESLGKVASSEQFVEGFTPFDRLVRDRPMQRGTGEGRQIACKYCVPATSRAANSISPLLCWMKRPTRSAIGARNSNATMACWAAIESRALICSNIGDDLVPAGRLRVAQARGEVAET